MVTRLVKMKEIVLCTELCMVASGGHPI